MFRCLRNIFVIVTLSTLVLISCEDTTSKPKRQLVSPEFSIQPGLFSQVLNVEITCPEEDARIFYTNDGTHPSEDSQVYQEPVLVTATTTLKAIAYHDDYLTSETISGTYWLNLAKVEDPIILTEAGTYYYQENIEIVCPTSEAEIYYTLDGSEPDLSSTHYQEVFTITDSCILKAKAFKQYYPASNITTAEYVITMPRVSVPTFSPSPGLYDMNQLVSLNCATEGASIYYTLDGSSPTVNSNLYNTPLYVDSSTTFKAIATKEDYLNSFSTTGQYIIEYQTVSEPEFSLESGYYLGNQTLSIETATPAASIYFTLDSSEPNQESTLYTSPIEISQPTIVKARAYKEYFNDSPIASAEYQVFQEATEDPILDPPPGNYIGMQSVSFTCSTPGAQIYYTLNGSEPTEDSFLYSAPLSIYETITLNVRAYAPGYYPSDIQGSRYYIGNPAPNDFVFVEGGEFSNYSADVTISSFYISNHEITQGEYRLTMGIWPPDGFGYGYYYPAYGLTWYEVVAYCNARSFEEELTPCYNLSDWTCDYEATGYRLPTEMEWMFAAKGGNYQPETNYNLYAGTNDQDLLIDYAWYDMYSNNSCYMVRGKLPNELGLYDMSGNVFEWCNDWFGEYNTEDQANPTGPETGSEKVVRGGAWNDGSEACKITSRSHANPSSSNPNIGFRLVRKAY